MNILLVDYSRVVRDRLRSLIATLPNTVVVAQADTEDAARQHLQTHRPELVVIDPQLRSGSGFSVISHVKSEHPRVTIMVLTNMVYPEYRAKCEGLGAHYFFDKSKETAAFVAQLARLCTPLSRAHHA
ncbi:response regulator [Rhodoferax sp.]|uniref:response regulator n=1 Tax=Rhodoferax sp. TaxID=50421 RepID=UPI0027719A26|nr:response regulator [Rhodoferax sp.]